MTCERRNPEKLALSRTSTGRYLRRAVAEPTRIAA